MIMPVCVRPMEDELLYGWLSRLSLENGYTSIKEFGTRFLAERTYCMQRNRHPGLQGLISSGIWTGSVRNTDRSRSFLPRMNCLGG